MRAGLRRRAGLNMLLNFLPLFAEELECFQEPEVLILLPSALLVLFAKAF